MAECLVCLIHHTAPMPEYGAFIDIREDGYGWKSKERPPRFAVIKIPGIEPSAIMKYLESHLEPDGRCIRQCKWRLRIESTVQAIKDKILANDIVVKTSAYAGTGDVNWTVFKNFIRNTETGLDETVEL